MSSHFEWASSISRVISPRERILDGKSSYSGGGNSAVSSNPCAGILDADLKMDSCQILIHTRPQYMRSNKAFDSWDARVGWSYCIFALHGYIYSGSSVYKTTLITQPSFPLMTWPKTSCRAVLRDLSKDLWQYNILSCWLFYLGCVLYKLVIWEIICLNLLSRLIISLLFRHWQIAWSVCFSVGECLFVLFSLGKKRDQRRGGPG